MSIDHPPGMSSRPSKDETKRSPSLPKAIPAIAQFSRAEAASSAAQQRINANFTRLSGVDVRISSVPSEIIPTKGTIAKHYPLKEAISSMHNARSNPSLPPATSIGNIHVNALPGASNSADRINYVASDDILYPSTPQNKKHTKNESVYEHIDFFSKDNTRESLPLPQAIPDSIRMVKSNKPAVVFTDPANNLKASRKNFLPSVFRQQPYEKASRKADTFSRRLKQEQRKSPSALDNLHKQTNPGSHLWSLKERVYLCSLHRFYKVSNKDKAILLNKIFNCDVFRKSQIDSQLVDLQYFGLHPAWVAVISPPLTSGVFDDIKENIEATAAIMDISIESNHLDISSPLTTGNKKGSPSIKKKRKKFHAILKNFSREEQVNGRMFELLMASEKEGAELHEEDTSRRTAFTESPCVRARARVNIPSYSNLDLENNVELAKDFEVVGFSPATLQPDGNIPALVFRCYDHNSAGINTPSYFRAGHFPNTRRSIYRPPRQESNRFETYFENHMSPEALGSPFVSVASSLLSVLKKAFQKSSKAVNTTDTTATSATSDIHITVINGPALASTAYHAGTIAARLKRRGFLRKMTYKASCEWLVWGEIPPSAIIHDISFVDFLRLCNTSPIFHSLSRAADLPRLATALVRTVKGSFLDHPIRALNAGSAAAIGTLARFFGVARGGCDKEHIALFVEQVCNGFVIEVAETKWAVCRKAFVGELLKDCSPHFATEKVKGAVAGGFQEGVKRAYVGLQSEMRRRASAASREEQRRRRARPRL